MMPPRRGARGALLRNPSFLAGALILLAVVAAALAAPLLYPDDPQNIVAAPTLWPGEDAAYPLGTDSLGRDIAAGLIHGARVSLLVGVAAAAIGLMIGTVIGAMGGYFGGWIDRVLSRLTELVQVIPSFLLVIVLVTIASPSIRTIALSIGTASFPLVARLVRAQFRSLRGRSS